MSLLSPKKSERMSSLLSDFQYPALEKEDDAINDNNHISPHGAADVSDNCGIATNSAVIQNPYRDMPPLTPRRQVSLKLTKVTRNDEVANVSPPITNNDEDGGKGPTSVDNSSYGYGRGSPDTAKVNQKIDTASYGYEAGFSPDVAKNKDQQKHKHHQHGQHRPPQHDRRPVTHKTHHTYDGTRVPRRSSLKSSSLHNPRNSGFGPGTTTHMGVGNQHNNNNFHGVRGTTDASMSSSASRPDLVGRRNSVATAPTTVVEVRMRGERLPVQRCRSIDFSKTVQVKEVQPITQLNENVKELWLQAEDFAAMKEHRRSLLKFYKDKEAAGEAIHSSSYNRTSATNGTSNVKFAPASTGSPPYGGGGPDEMTVFPVMSVSSVEENDSFRGLEKYIDKSGRRQKNMGWDSVLLEQDTQEVSGYFDEERIAELYKQQTSESPEKALARAAQDRAEVEEYLMSPRTMKLMQRTKMTAIRRLSC